MLTLELHHLEWVREGGGNDVKNLIALCSNCHDAHTHEHIPRQSLDAWKQMLMLVSGSLDRDSLDLLLFLHSSEKRQQDEYQRRKKWEHDKEEEYERLAANPDTTQRQFTEHEEKWKVIEPPYFSEAELRVQGDGLLRLVRLIRTGLVVEGRQRFELSDGLSFYFWEPKLTASGQRLAEAFINGDANTFRELLAGSRGETDGGGA
jgi:hypothetical protein